MTASASGDLRPTDHHVHLEGTLNRGLARELATRHGRAATLPSWPSDRWPDPATWFSTMRQTGDCCLRDPEDYVAVARHYAGQLRRDGAAGAVLTVSLARAHRQHAAPGEVLGALVAYVTSTGQDDGPTLRLFVGLDRRRPELAEEHAALACGNAGPVVGIDLQGVPTAPLERFAEAAALAHAHGLTVRVHAGEHEGPRSISAALDVLGATRIAHGITAVQDDRLLCQLSGTGVVLDLALTGNVALGLTASYRTHPLARLIEAGVPVTLGTDDPAYFGTTIALEYARAAELGVTDDELAAMQHRTPALQPAPTR